MTEKISAIESASSASSARAYSAVLKSNIASLARKGPAQSVSLARGKSFNIQSAERVIISPLESAKAQYPTSVSLKTALQSIVNPVKMKLDINRVDFGPESSVIIEGEGLSSTCFRNNPRITEAGLEFRVDKKLNPRLVVHDIPISPTEDEIKQKIVERNSPGASVSDVEIVYMYPARDIKLNCSCVIETSPEHRLAFITRRKININWLRSRVEDHIKVLQCFKYYRFSHMVEDCQNEVCCGYCAGEHWSRDCESKNSSECVNRLEAKNVNHVHAFSDEGKCIISRKEIERKLTLINHG